MVVRDLDRVQAAAVAALAAADGRTLSYEELGASGVAHPACVAYELAAAGWPVMRSAAVDSEGRRRPGLRMLPGEAPVAGPAPRRHLPLALLGHTFR